RRVVPDFGEPRGRAGTDGVGGKTDFHPRRAEPLHLLEIVADRALAEPLETTALVRCEQQHDLDPCRAGRLCGGKRFGKPEIVELADRGVSGRTHLAVGRLVLGSHTLWRLLDR